MTRSTGVTELVSRRTDGTQGNAWSGEPSISGDGRYVAFTSEADNLFASDGNQDPDVFVRDRVAGKLAHASRRADGTPFDRSSYSPQISSDGKFVVFTTDAWNVASEDGNGRSDCVRVELATRAVEIVSENCFGTSANDESRLPACSGDGRVVSFVSKASDLVHDGLGGWHAYARDFGIPFPEASRADYGAGWAGTRGVPAITASVDPEWGSVVDLAVENSSGAWTFGFLLVGHDEATIPTNRGGDLLVDFFLFLPVVLSPGGWLDHCDVPFDVALSGSEFDFQMVQIDSGASHGMSFTRGLKLIVGR